MWQPLVTVPCLHALLFFFMKTCVGLQEHLSKVGFIFAPAGSPRSNSGLEQVFTFLSQGFFLWVITSRGAGPLLPILWGTRVLPPHSKPRQTYHTPLPLRCFAILFSWSIFCLRDQPFECPGFVQSEMSVGREFRLSVSLGPDLSFWPVGFKSEPIRYHVVHQPPSCSHCGFQFPFVLSPGDLMFFVNLLVL